LEDGPQAASGNDIAASNTGRKKRWNDMVDLIGIKTVGDYAESRQVLSIFAGNKKAGASPAFVMALPATKTCKVRSSIRSRPCLRYQDPGVR